MGLEKAGCCIPHCSLVIAARDLLPPSAGFGGQNQAGKEAGRLQALSPELAQTEALKGSQHLQEP